MKVLVAGLKWEALTVEGMAHGFEGLGHEVRIFHDNIYRKRNLYFILYRGFQLTPFRRVSDWNFEKYRAWVSQKFLEEVKRDRPDLIVVVQGNLFLPEVINEIRDQMKVPIVNWIIDDPVLSGRTLVYDLSFYSHLFFVDRSWMPHLEFFNSGNLSFLPHAADAKGFFKPLNKQRDFDIAFAGNLSLKPPHAPSSGFLRAQILNALAGKGLKIKAFAPGISQTFAYYPALKHIDYYDGYCSPRETNELYNSAKITLGINSPQLHGGLPLRVFDAAIAKCFQLIQYGSDADELFEGTVISFKNIQELIERVDYYLENEKERERLASAAYNLALEKHTFANRAQTIIDTCF